MQCNANTNGPVNNATNKKDLQSQQFNANTNNGKTNPMDCYHPSQLKPPTNAPFHQ